MEFDEEGFTVVQGDKGEMEMAKHTLAMYNLARGMLQIVSVAQRLSDMLVI